MGAEVHWKRETEMILIIGGFAQGKLHYVKQNYAHLEDGREVPVLDGTLKLPSETGAAQVIVNHLHCYIREQLRQGTDPEKMIVDFLEKHPECILICDEIGNGIVPMEAEERIYRERTGRILEQLAAQADEVVRVVCGIGQRIK